MEIVEIKQDIVILFITSQDVNYLITNSPYMKHIVGNYLSLFIHPTYTLIYLRLPNNSTLYRDCNSVYLHLTQT